MRVSSRNICSAKTCYNTRYKDPDLAFFAYPNNVEMAHIWATNAGREDMLKKNLRTVRKYVLCAEHFESKYFQNPVHRIAFKVGCSPIPTIFKNNISSVAAKELPQTYTILLREVTHDIENINEYKNDCSFATYDLKNINCDLVFDDHIGKFAYTDELYEDKVRNKTTYEKDLLPNKFVTVHCRLCAKVFPLLDLTSIFKHGNFGRLWENIELCLPGMVTTNDGLSQEVCKGCIAKLEHCSGSLRSFFQANDKLKAMNENEMQANILNKKCRIYGRNQNDAQQIQQSQGAIEHKAILHEFKEHATKIEAIQFRTKEFEVLHHKTTLREVKQYHGKQFASKQLITNQNQDKQYESKQLQNAQCKVIQYVMKRHDFEQLKIRRQNRDKQRKAKEKVNQPEEKPDEAIKQEAEQLKAVLNEIEQYEIDENKTFSLKYQCLICAMLFQNESDFNVHKLKSHVWLKSTSKSFRIVKTKKFLKKRYKCPHCSEVFLTPTLVRRHKRQTHKYALYNCGSCDSTFRNSILLRAHQYEHTGHKAYVCDDCGLDFDFKGSLRKHRQEKHKFGGTCQKCGKTFTTNSTYQRHLQGHENFLCSECGKLFSKSYQLKKHMLSHVQETPHVCKICLKSFKCKPFLYKHQETHNAEKNYVCQICGGRFRTRQVLRQHMQIHTLPKQYKCDLCGKMFRRRGNLVQHRKRHENIGFNSTGYQVRESTFTFESALKIHTEGHGKGNKCFECRVCLKLFQTKHQWKVHYRLHSGERPYKCDLCDKEFRSKTTMKQHRLVHFDIYPHKCSLCDRKFKRLTSYLIHRQTHTGEKPYACPHCGRPFAQRGDMLKHTRIHTGIRKKYCKSNAKIPTRIKKDNTNSDNDVQIELNKEDYDESD